MRETGRWTHAFKASAEELGSDQGLGATLSGLMELVRGEIEGLSTVEVTEPQANSGRRKLRM
jgi:hypothetical protein